MTIDVSNAMHYVEKCNSGIRAGDRFTDACQKQRNCTSSDQSPC